MRLIAVLLVLFPATSYAQHADFAAEEFADRRARVMAQIGPEAIAVVQGAGDVDGFKYFRQSSTMYYLTGIETPHSYLVIDGRSGRSTLYLPHQDPGRERSEGETLAAEDAEAVKAISGVEDVMPIEQMGRNWVYRYLVRSPHPMLYTPHGPAETGSDSRDELLRYRANLLADPWDGRVSREGAFINQLRQQYPQFDIRDLSPVLDKMRIVKSPAEIALIRRASRLAGEGLLEAMRCTGPGVMEYQIEACARFAHQRGGARRDAYTAIVGGGTNAFMGHYHANDDSVEDGDLVLMDFAPEYRYYTSDVTRIWPVNGTFSDDQLELYRFIVSYQSALLAELRPGITVREVLDRSAAVMQDYVDTHKWSSDAYRSAAQDAVSFRGHMQHPVGLAVHDVGSYKSTPLRVGEVFAVDPMMWVRPESLYVRVEDVVVITEDGYENFTDFLPVQPDDIEAVMREPGLLESAASRKDLR